MNRSILGSAIRSLRSARGLTQIELAMRAGLSRATVSALETGHANPSVSTLTAIARPLGQTFAELVALGSRPRRAGR